MKCLPGTPCRNDPSGTKPRKKPPALTIENRGLCCVCPGIQQFLRVFQHLLNGAVIRVDLAVGAFRQAQQFLEPVTHQHKVPVKVGVLIEQVLYHLRLVGDHIIHAKAQQGTGVLRTVDRPGGHRLAA